MSDVENELYYLRKILHRLREYRTIFHSDTLTFMASLLGLEALADEIDWLDCYIDKKDKVE